jgi:hypothetical protein
MKGTTKGTDLHAKVKIVLQNLGIVVQKVTELVTDTDEKVKLSL